MARTSAVGYIAAKRQSGLGVPDTGTSGFTFFRFLSAPRGSAELTNNRYREGGGGRDVTLSLKEGIKHAIEFPCFARPTIMGFLLSAGTGVAAAGIGGGGTTSNGLVRQPKLKAASTISANLSNSYAAGAAVVMATTTSATPFANGTKVAIGWGPNLEFVTLTAGGANSATGTIIFPHAKGEPIYEVKGIATIATIASSATGLTTFTLTASHGFVTADTLAIGANSVSTLLGAELGAAEELAAVVITTNTVTCTAMRNGHSVGDWVYEYDGAVTSRIHGFEPISSLTGTLDYFTLERTVSGSNDANSVIDRLVDAKLGTMELSGESPGPVRLQCGWMSRYGTRRTSSMTESYTNQSSTDLPFRMPNGKFLIQFGTSIGLSTKLRQFTWNFSNQMADDIYTDAISSDDILDLARESNFSAQFYFESSAEYYEIIYGSSNPANNAVPTANAVTGPMVLDFTISTDKRMSIYVPSVTWENFPVEVDPEPKPIIVEATGVPLKQPGQPLYSIAVQNADVTVY